MNKDPKLSATGLADYLLATTPEKKISILREQKFTDKSEGFFMAGYYQATNACARDYHASSNDVSLVTEKLNSLNREAEDPSKHATARANRRKNHAAIQLYMKLYGERHLSIEPLHKIFYVVRGLRINGTPDIWAKEGTRDVLLKLGAAKRTKRDVFIEIVLYAMNRAAAASGYTIPRENIRFLDLLREVELVAQYPADYFDSSVEAVAEEVVKLWDQVTPPILKPRKTSATGLQPDASM